MYRREFLKITALTCAGLSLPRDFGALTEVAVAASDPDLAVVSGSTPEKILKTAIDTLGGIKKFISRGDIVVVKPNIGWDRIPEQAANTNPDVVAATIKLCFEAGAKKVKVFDRSVNDPRRCYIQSGIAPAAKSAGAEVNYIDERKFKDVTINGAVLKSWPLYTELLEADKIINLPIAKTHGLAKLTLSMKNWMGMMGGPRSQIHQKLDDCLVDLLIKIRPTLTILDAIRILTANGPQGGSLADVKKIDTVVVGKDQIAVDSYGTTLFGLKAGDLAYLKRAEAIGLGTADLRKLKIEKIHSH